MLHPSFQYRKGASLNLAETTMIYQYQFERLENLKIDLLLIRVKLLKETNLQEKSKLLKRLALLKQETSIIEDSIEISLKCWEILIKGKELN